MQTPVELLWRCAYSKTPVLAQTRLDLWPKDFVAALMEGGYLIRHSKNANYIKVGDEAYEIYETLYVNGKNRFFYNDEYGKHHEVKPKDLALYLVRFTPLANLLHDSLPCRGNIEELVPNLLWKVGAAGQQSREVYLARNWGSEPAVQCIINNIKPGSLLFRLGCNPISYSFEAEQVYDIADLMEWTGKSLFLNARAVHKNLKDMVTKHPKRRGKNTYSRQENYQEQIESYLWSWFDKKLQIAKDISKGIDVSENDLNRVRHSFSTQQELAESIGVRPDVLVRAKTAWKTTPGSFGDLFLAIVNEFIKKSSNSTDSESHIDKLNDFYKRHSDKISRLRKERPNCN